jgi:hypothetical protein
VRGVEVEVEQRGGVQAELRCCWGLGASASISRAACRCDGWGAAREPDAGVVWSSGVECRLSAGVGGGGPMRPGRGLPVVVTAGVQQGSRTQAWCYDAAGVSSAGWATNGPSSGCTSATVAGLGFCERRRVETSWNESLCVWKSRSGVLEVHNTTSPDVRGYTHSRLKSSSVV